MKIELNKHIYDKLVILAEKQNKTVDEFINNILLDYVVDHKKEIK